MKIIFRLLTFVKKRWPTLLLGFICIEVSTVGGLVIPRLIGNGIDTALTSGDKSRIVTLALIILGTTILRSAGRFGDTYITQLVSQQASYDIRNALYDHLHKLGFAYYDKAQTGQIMSRCTADIEAARMFLSAGLLNLIQIFTIVFGISYFLFTIDWLLALMTLAFMPLIFWQTTFISKKLQPVWAKVQQGIGVLGVTLQESLFGVKVVKAFVLQGKENAKFGGQANDLYDNQIAAAKMQAVFTPVMTVLVSLPVILVLWWGGRQVIAGNITVGEITQYILYLGTMAGFVSRLGQLANMISRTLSAGHRIFEILDTEPAVQDKPDAITMDEIKGDVAFNKVSFSYGSTSPLLQDIDFKVGAGRMVALVGGSGSGKTTVINLISRFYDVTDGSITIDGVDIRDMKLSSLRKNVVVTQQDIFLFSTTIKENISYGVPHATGEQIEAAAKAARIHDFIMTLPKGYETWVGERGVTLSGGEKQRVAIARSILVDPSILILDDSTSSVDSETEYLILKALNKLIEGRTTFVITHRLPIIRNADLILVLEDGKIAESGTHTELMAKNGLYKATYEGQLLSGSNDEDDPEGEGTDGN